MIRSGDMSQKLSRLNMVINGPCEPFSSVFQHCGKATKCQLFLDITGKLFIRFESNKK